MPGLKKRSMSLGGHATSVALEPEFWAVLNVMAEERKLSLPQLLANIDEARGEKLLASSCRLAALAYSQGRSSTKLHAVKPMRRAA